jgi:hypothetical protein
LKRKNERKLPPKKKLKMVKRTSFILERIDKRWPAETTSRVRE